MSQTQALSTSPQPSIQGCKFCNETDQDCLEEHHIVPKRHGGSDKKENLVKLCASCHRKLESLYNKRFYHKVNKARFNCPYCSKPHNNFTEHKEHTMRCNEDQKVTRLES